MTITKLFLAVLSLLWTLSCATVATPNSGPGGTTLSGRLLINEMVVDPKQDWNDSAGGNAVPFDGTPGSGIPNTGDEWIELYNASTQAVNLTGWLIEMNDGTPASEDFSGSSGAVYMFSAGSSMTNLLPGGFLVIGDFQGDMTLVVTVRLYNPSVELVDIVTAGSNGIPDGDANDTTDEALSRQDNASTTWVHQAATIGTDN